MFRRLKMGTNFVFWCALVSCFFFCFPREIGYHKNHQNGLNDISNDSCFSRDSNDIGTIIKNCQEKLA